MISMKAIVLAAAVAASVAGLMAVGASAAGRGDFHYTGRHGQGPCVNVEFPQNDWFHDNEFSIDDARAIAEQNGGLFFVGRLDTGQGDVVPASSPFASQMHDGGVSVDDPPKTYVDVDSYILEGGRCKEEGGQSSSGGEGNAPPPPPESSVFLCYSQWQTNPGLWPSDQAADLVQQGYWLPVAETSVPTPTKIGNYYLYCNGTNTGLPHFTTGSGRIDASGNLLDPDSVFGHYPVAS
jgi:hypothetical protein